MVTTTDNLFQAKKIDRERYFLEINESTNKKFVTFKLIPKSYTKNVILNLIFSFIIITIGCYYVIFNFHFSQQVQVLSMLLLFVTTNMVIKAPRIDSFTIIKEYGIQLSQITGWNIFPYSVNKKYFAENEFIPRGKIVDIIINEGFQPGFQVVFYLALIVNESKKLQLLFPVCIVKFGFVVNTR